jgi:DNA-binding response OmpR family regulator
MIIIIVTATTRNSEVPDSVWRIGTPADGFLSKPFDPSELRNLIQKLRAEAEQSQRG